MSSAVAASENLPNYPLYGWVNRFTPPSQGLKWVHTTDAFALRHILTSRRLTPQHCPVFNEPLTYMFYGRPAYRFKNRQAMMNTFSAPVVLVFSERVLAHAHRLFPFDTGAFEGGRYGKWMHEKMTLESFEYPTNSDGQGKHVAAFYGGNQQYWDGEGAKLDNIAGEYEVEALSFMIQDTTAVEADDRRLAVELIVKDEIPMTAEYVEAIVMPTSVVDAKFVEQFTKDEGVKILQYRANKNKPAIEYQALLENTLEELHDFLGAL